MDSFRSTQKSNKLCECDICAFIVISVIHLVCLGAYNLYMSVMFLLSRMGVRSHYRAPADGSRPGGWDQDEPRDPGEGGCTQVLHSQLFPCHISCLKACKHGFHVHIGVSWSSSSWKYCRAEKNTSKALSPVRLCLLCRSLASMTSSHCARTMLVTASHLRYRLPLTTCCYR